jgi:hypothetical protein
MPALVETEFTATIKWLGKVPDRDASLLAAAQHEMELSFAGPVGEAHAGLTRASCTRVRTQYPIGTQIRNVRQLTLVSQEELSAIALVLGLDALDPVLLGASLVLEGIPDFTHIPPSSRLIAANGTSLVVDMENQPCNLVSREIERVAAGHGRGFKQAARGKRGVTAWVEREGSLAVGDVLRLHIPSQRAWSEQLQMPTA